MTTAETSSSRPAPPGFDMGRSRQGAQLAVDQPSSDAGGSIPSGPPRASRLTGRAPGSYPGQDWVRGPGRAPSRRSSASGSAGLSSRRSRVQVPPVAPRRRGRMDQGAGLRNRRVQVRPLPSTLGSFTCLPRGRPSRRSSAGTERRPPKAEAARSNRAGETNTVVREAIRLDEEPCSKHGTGASPWAFESPRFRSRRDRPAGRTPGPQPGNRGSNPRRGTRSSRCQVVERQDVRLLPGRLGVRAPPWQRSARWPRIEARGCNPRSRR